METTITNKWLRVRFRTREEDYRPIKFPPPGPYWCSGYGEDHAILVGYFKLETEIIEFWPDAYDLDVMKIVDEIKFSSRFPKPDWWNEEVKNIEGK